MGLTATDTNCRMESEPATSTVRLSAASYSAAADLDGKTLDSRVGIDIGLIAPYYRLQMVVGDAAQVNALESDFVAADDYLQQAVDAAKRADADAYLAAAAGYYQANGAFLAVSADFGLTAARSFDWQIAAAPPAGRISGE